MGMWRIIISAVLIAALLGIIYLTACIAGFGGIKRLSRGKRWLRYLLALGITAAGFALASLLLSVMNAIVILLHLVVFFLLSGLVCRIVRRVRKKDFRYYWKGWSALTASALYLTAGWVLCHSVRQTDYHLTTDKLTGSLRIAMLADSHIGTTFDADGFAAHLQTIAAQSPDLLLIPGDFIDSSTSREEMLRACEALGGMHLPYGVWYCCGNHDQGYLPELAKAMTECGVHVLADDCMQVDDRFYVAGRRDKYAGRKDVSALLADADPGKYIILLDHQPNDYDAEAASAADLVLSGHTHGGQLLPVTFVGEWLGMNDKTYGYERRNGTDFIVTSGISCWEIRFKTGTRSEYVIIDIAGR